MHVAQIDVAHGPPELFVASGGPASHSWYF